MRTHLKISLWSLVLDPNAPGELPGFGPVPSK